MIDVSGLKVGDVVEIEYYHTPCDIRKDLGYIVEICDIKLVTRQGFRNDTKTYWFCDIKQINVMFPKPSTAGQCVIEEP